MYSLLSPTLCTEAGGRGWVEGGDQEEEEREKRKMIRGKPGGASVADEQGLGKER